MIQPPRYFAADLHPRHIHLILKLQDVNFEITEIQIWNFIGIKKATP